MTSGILHHCVFVGECNFNIWTIKTRVGQRAYRQVCGQRGRGNVTITLAVSHLKGLVHHTAQIGGMNARRFSDFLTEARQKLDPKELVNFIYDGAVPAHRNADNPGANTELKMLPPCSPFLNIVEEAILALQAAIKADISQPVIQDELNNRDEARRQDISLGDYRQEILLEASRRRMNAITQEKCAQWFQVMQTHIPRCIKREPTEN